MRTIGYVRVSTEEQAREGVSLEAQQAAIESYCTLRGFEIAEVIVDAGVSAGKPLGSREGGERLLNAVRDREVNAVVAYKLDRIFRDAGDCLNVTQEWDRAEISLHLIDLGGQAIDTATAMGRFFLTVMAGAAEMERNLIRERTRAALGHKRDRGELVGSVPYGSRLSDDGVHLVDDETEQAVIRRARELKSRGHSLRGIARKLGLEGFEPRGKSWHPQTVKRILEAA